MAIVRYRLDPNNPPELTREQVARLDAMMPEEIERNAIEDAENPPSTDEELDRGVAARAVRLARERTGLSQNQFAERFHINPARLKDWEQGRHQPDSVALAYLKVIEKDPGAVERALGAA
jgi:putative transcriptional regulator